MNAIDEQLYLEVRAAALEAGDREDVRAVVIYGGERVFAAGADIKGMSQLDGRSMVAWGRELTDPFTAGAENPQAGLPGLTGQAPRRRDEAGPCGRLRGLGGGGEK